MPRATPTLPQDGLCLRDALREYGLPRTVARLNRILKDLRDLQGLGDLRGLKDLEDDAEKVGYELWQHLKSKLVAGDLTLTWQPSDPTADRTPLAPDRCRRLQARLAADDREDSVSLDGHVLLHVLIHTAKGADVVSRPEVRGGAAGVTGDKPLPRIPPLWVPLAELARWLQEMHGLTETEIRDVVVDLRRVSLWFRVLDGSAEEDENLKSWNGLEVQEEDWGAGRARWKHCPDSKYFPLVVSWGAVTDAVTRLRRRERLALQAPAPGPAMAAGEPKPNAANSGKPTFDARTAMVLLKAKKDSGHWPNAPKEGVTRDYLLQFFSGVSNDPHRDIRREVWPDMRRGRRTEQRTGGLTDKKR